MHTDQSPSRATLNSKYARSCPIGSDANATLHRALRFTVGLFSQAACHRVENDFQKDCPTYTGPNFLMYNLWSGAQGFARNLGGGKGGQGENGARVWAVSDEIGLGKREGKCVATTLMVTLAGALKVAS